MIVLGGRGAGFVRWSRGQVGPSLWGQRTTVAYVRDEQCVVRGGGAMFVPGWVVSFDLPGRPEFV